MLCSKDLVLKSIGPFNIHHALSKVLQMGTKRSYDVIWKQFNISSQKFGITFAPFLAKHWPQHQPTPSTDAVYIRDVHTEQIDTTFNAVRCGQKNWSSIDFSHLVSPNLRLNVFRLKLSIEINNKSIFDHTSLASPPCLNRNLLTRGMLVPTPTPCILATSIGWPPTAPGIWPWVTGDLTVASEGWAISMGVLDIFPTGCFCKGCIWHVRGYTWIYMDIAGIASLFRVAP